MVQWERAPRDSLSTFYWGFPSLLSLLDLLVLLTHLFPFLVYLFCFCGECHGNLSRKGTEESIFQTSICMPENIPVQPSHLITEVLKMLVAQSCLTLSDLIMVCPWNSPGKNTGVGCHFLLQGIFLIQEFDPVLLHCRQILYHLSYQGSLVTWLLVYLEYEILGCE